jgi:hypothetical protein
MWQLPQNCGLEVTSILSSETSIAPPSRSTPLNTNFRHRAVKSCPTAAARFFTEDEMFES